VTTLAERLRARLGFGAALGGFAGAAAPDAETVLAQAAASGCRRVVVFPFFLFTGVLVRRVQGAVAAGMPAADAFAARRKVMAEIEKESLAATGLRSDVVTLHQGGLYHLYRAKKYTDVRLVFAPEQQIAFFGGDADNFEFPRFNLDVTGKSAAEAMGKLKNNVEYWVTRGRYNKVRVKRNGKAVLPDIPVGALVAVEAATFFWTGLLRAALVNVVGRAFFEVELINEASHAS
jgi:hypothetical protein